MNKICGYNCEHNKGGICQITYCDKIGKMTTTTQEPVVLTRWIDPTIEELKTQLQQKENIIKEVREKVDNFDVFKEFTFPLMKRDEEQQVKSSIDYEWRKSIKEPILEILDKGE